jgi:SAM-dependent methyltransferase
MTAGTTATLLDSACEPYRRAGRFAYHFARGKLGSDPVFPAILERGLLTDRTRLLDLGCGQGLLSAWLRAARQCADRGQWPKGWPSAPRILATRGIELMASDVARAYIALGASCGIVQGDIRHADFGQADAAVILDVLHYMEKAAQREIVRRVRAALPTGGLMLLRVGDADGGWRFRYSQWVDKVVMLIRGHSLVTTHCRGLNEWRELLEQCGFEAEATPMSQGTPFANVLLVARAR